MSDKDDILDKLTDTFKRWRELIAGLSEQQILQPLTPSSWTIKDTVAHLWAWEQASLARAEAALEDREPWYPGWWEACGPDPEEDVNRTNAFIYEANREKPWPQVYTDWEEQFRHYLEISQLIPEKDLVEVGRFPWMGKYPLIASPVGAWDHHQEHYDTITEWIKTHGKTRP